MLQYYVLDVFTTEKYKGNPLSVVLVDEDLEVSDYQKIAHEFGYSETSFIQFSSESDALKVRSFTPAGVEVDGAGHNLLGAVCLALLKGWNIFEHQKNEQFVIMETQPIRVSVKYDTNNPPFVGMLQKSAEILNEVPVGEIAKALNTDSINLSVQTLKPTVVKTEVAHLMVSVKDADALNQLIPNKDLLSELGRKYSFQGCYCFTLNGQNSVHLAQARFFNPGIGIDEDAATGTAAGPLAGFLFHNNLINLNQDYALLQGEKMGHPSTIHFQVTDEGIRVSGSAVIVMEGTLFLS